MSAACAESIGLELETDHLLLRPFRATDLPHLQRYATRPEFYEFLSLPEQTPETVAAFLEHRLKSQEQHHTGRFAFAIELKPVKRVIGSVRIEISDATNKQGDLGFALDPDHQRRGYMTEAVARVLAFGFGQLSLHRVFATADVENHRSWRLMERLGMIREGLLRQDKLVRGQWRDSFLYAILSEEFVGKRGGSSAIGDGER